jgi:hypothetical protein
VNNRYGWTVHADASTARWGILAIPVEAHHPFLMNDKFYLLAALQVVSTAGPTRFSLKLNDNKKSDCKDEPT